MNDRSDPPADRARFWLASYPPDTPPDIDPSQLPTLKDMCERACACYGDSPAYVQGGSVLSYRELEARSRSFGAWLQAIGAKKGDRLALLLPNIIEFPIALFGALRAGLAVVTLNPLYTTSELQQVLEDSRPVALVTLEALRPSVEACETHANLRCLVSIGAAQVDAGSSGELRTNDCRHALWAHIVHAPSAQAFEDESVDPSDLAFIQYTGGTTGSPKGVMLTHRNVCANILQSVAWISATARTQSTLITLLPLYHIFALEGSLLLFTHLGWRNVLVADARNVPAVVAELARYPVAFLSGVNTLFRALLAAPGFSALDFSHLEITLSGGMASEPEVAQRWHDVTGCHITQAWGLTETSPGACINLPGTAFNGSVGLPIPSTEIAIKDQSGADLPLGENGEICVRGPQVTSGYWRRPDETARAFWPGGWLRTGDAGHLDEKGFLYLIERLKDVIVVSGFKVYPREVEAMAASYPGVLEAAAVAQHDPRSGESVALFVVCSGTPVASAELIWHCRQSLAPYKVPKHVYFRTALPKSAVGKILRKSLREEVSKPLLE